MTVIKESKIAIRADQVQTQQILIIHLQINLHPIFMNKFSNLIIRMNKLSRLINHHQIQIFHLIHSQKKLLI